MSQYPAAGSTLPYSGRLLLDPRFDFDLAAEVSSRLDGLVAIGGKITPETLIKGYSIGCFPWSSEGQAILWYCLLPRMYLDLRRGPKFRRSLLKILRHKSYTVTKDACFEETLKLCGSIPRPGQIGTWLRRDLVDALSQARRGALMGWPGWNPAGCRLRRPLRSRRFFALRRRIRPGADSVRSRRGRLRRARLRRRLARRFAAAAAGC